MMRTGDAASGAANSIAAECPDSLAKSVRRTQWARRLARAFVFPLTLLITVPVVELWLEGRDARRLTADDTFVPVGEASIRYRRTGAGHAGPPVVFLNGMAGSLEQFDRAQSDVSSFADVLTYDRGGTGFSYGSAAYDAEQQADELASLLQALGMDRPIVLVGFSSAASNARVFVARYREKVASMVLLYPYLPEIENHLSSPWRARAYTRWLTSDTLRSLYSVKRVSRWVKDLQTPVEVDPPEQKAEAVLRRFHHWWAVDREWLATRETNRQVAAADGFHDLPLVVLSEDLSEMGELGRVQDELVQNIASRSRYGSVRKLRPEVEHGDSVKRGANYEALVAAIREMREREY